MLNIRDLKVSILEVDIIQSDELLLISFSSPPFILSLSNIKLGQDEENFFFVSCFYSFQLQSISPKLDSLIAFLLSFFCTALDLTLISNNQTLTKSTSECT